MVRSSPRASAGFRRFAASPVPAAPPAPISVCASSMKRMTGVSEACTSSMTARSRFSNSPLTLAPACISPTSSIRRLTSLQHRRHVALGEAQREALDDRGLADPGLAGEDRVVLPPPHQHVDDLADLRVAADHRVDLAVPRPRGQVGGVLRQRRVAARPAPRRRLGRRSRARRGRPRSSRRARPSRRAPIASASILSNSPLILPRRRVEHRHLERGEQDVGRAHRLVAELERAVAPALLDGVEDVVGEFLDRGGAVGQPVDRPRHVGGEAGGVDPGLARGSAARRARSESTSCSMKCASST